MALTRRKAPSNQGSRAPVPQRAFAPARAPFEFKDPAAQLRLDPSIALKDAMEMAPKFVQSSKEDAYVGSEQFHLDYEDVNADFLGEAARAVEQGNTASALAMAVMYGGRKAIVEQAKEARTILRDTARVRLMRQDEIDTLSEIARGTQVYADTVFSEDSPELDGIETQEDMMRLVQAKIAQLKVEGHRFISEEVFPVLFRQLQAAVKARAAKRAKRAAASAVGEFNRARMRFMASGSEDDRRAMIDAEDRMANSRNRASGTRQLSIRESLERARKAPPAPPLPQRERVSMTPRKATAKELKRIRDDNMVSRSMRKVLGVDERGNVFIRDEDGARRMMEIRHRPKKDGL